MMNENMIEHEDLPIAVRQVGRDIRNPNNRNRGGQYAQRLEIKERGLMGCLTTVGKDNYLLEDTYMNAKDTINEDTQIVESNIKNIIYEYRIRKLTPRECWRLMGDKDSDFEKAESVNSNTQLYKEAGNAICKNVLMALFSQLNIDGVTPWNDLTDEECDSLVTDGCFIAEVA